MIGPTCYSAPRGGYSSRRFRRARRRLGATQFMGRVGSCFDNAVSEAFNSILKVEYVHRHTFRTIGMPKIRAARAALRAVRAAPRLRGGAPKPRCHVPRPGKPARVGRS